MTHKQKAKHVAILIESLLWIVYPLVVGIGIVTAFLGEFFNLLYNWMIKAHDYRCLSTLRRKTLSRWVRLDKELGENTTIAQAKKRDVELGFH